MVKLQNPRYVFIFQFTAHLPNSLFIVTLLLTLVTHRLFHFVMSFALSFRLSTILLFQTICSCMCPVFITFWSAFC